LKSEFEEKLSQQEEEHEQEIEDLDNSNQLELAAIREERAKFKETAKVIKDANKIFEEQKS